MQENVVKECEELFGTSDRAPTIADLGQMKYLDACIKESLRLYPPVHFIMRTFEEPLKLSKFKYNDSYFHFLIIMIKIEAIYSYIHKNYNI